MSIERIVVGVDFSAASFETARWVARHLTRAAELVLAHVIALPEPPPILRGRFPRRDLVLDTLRAGADRRLRELSETLGCERVWIDVREGDVVPTLATVAREYAADVVAVGAHGERPGLASALGSTAEHVVRTSGGPVLLVAGNTSVEPTRILAAVDEPPAADAALRWARVLGDALDAQITALHVLPARAVARLTVEEPAARAHHGAGAVTATERVRRVVAFGDPATEIVAAAGRMEAGMLVMGRRGAGNVRRALLGSVVDAVLRNAPCPVLVVPD